MRLVVGLGGNALGRSGEPPGEATWRPRLAQAALVLARIASQHAPNTPTCLPTNVSMKIHGMQPSVVSSVNRQNGIRATPAGSEMNVRMIGSMRVKKTVAEP